MKYQVLTDEQVEHFLTRGYVHLRECFSRKIAKKMTDHAFERLGFDRDDPSTWKNTYISMPPSMKFNPAKLSPRAWGAACDLVGGEERIWPGCLGYWGNNFVANLGHGADSPWDPPTSPRVDGWHKDGDWFHHFLDSPEQALLPIFIWSDIEHKGGGTFLAVDSVPVVARLLAEHPEGVVPQALGNQPVDMPSIRSLISQCKDYVELTGRAGDVVLVNPFMLHSASQNHLGVPRFISNPALSILEPMNFNRDNPNEFSIMERAILHALGVSKLDFRPTGPRRRYRPLREQVQNKILEQERTGTGVSAWQNFL